jgi:hypothetical protein
MNTDDWKWSQAPMLSTAYNSTTFGLEMARYNEAYGTQIQTIPICISRETKLQISLISVF